LFELEQQKRGNEHGDKKLCLEFIGNPVDLSLDNGFLDDFVKALYPELRST
jgi:hypothetical protein